MSLQENGSQGEEPLNPPPVTNIYNNTYYGTVINESRQNSTGDTSVDGKPGEKRKLTLWEKAGIIAVIIGTLVALAAYFHPWK